MRPRQRSCRNRHRSSGAISPSASATPSVMACWAGWPPRRFGWLHPSWAIACSVVLVAALIFGVRDSRLSRVVSAPALTPSSAGEVANTDDPAWSLLTDVAAAIEQDDPQAAPVAVRPSEVDRAVTDLSAPEREELRRLLQNDMRRAGD